MRIESIYIRGFGKIIDRHFDFPQDKAVLVIEDNECGKSTLAAAILAGICGFPSRKKKGEQVKLKDVYRPWNAESYGVEMVIEAGGKRYKIERDFIKDSTVIRDFDTNKDISAEFEQDLAGHFLGLPREDFQRVAFISGKEVNLFDSSATIQTKLAAIVSGSQDESGADIALDILDGTGYQLGGRSIKIKTAVARLSDQIEEKKSRLSELDKELDLAGDEAAMLDETRTLTGELSERIKSLDEEYRSARLRDVREQIAAAEDAERDIAALKSELESLEPYADFPAERSTQLAKTATRLAERSNRLDELAKKQENAHQQEDAIKARLDASAHFATATSEDSTQLGASESAIKEAQNALARRREELECEKRALGAEGIDVDGAIGMWRQFESLPQDEREFIRSYRETHLQLASDLQQSQIQSQQASSQLQSIIRKRSSMRSRGRILLAIGGIAGIACVSLMILHTLGIIPSLIGTLLGIITASAGAVNAARAASVDADEKANLQRQYESAESLAGELSARQNDNISHLAKLSGKLQIPADDLVESFKRCERSVGRCESLNALNARIMQAEESLESAVDRAKRQLSRFGIAGAADVLAELANARSALNKYLEDSRSLRSASIDLASFAREISSLQENIKDERKTIDSIFCDAGIDASLPLEDATKEFEQKESHYRRYIEIKDSLIPSAAKRIIPEDTISRLKAEEASLCEQFEQLSEVSARTISDIESDRANAREKLDSAIQRANQLEKSVGACVDTYRREYPALQDDIKSLETELAKVVRFGNALKLAEDTLREVSQNTYRRWADALNLHASGILSQLNPDYDTLRFDESLNFTIRHISLDKIIEKNDIDARLSTGAKDQIYLAVKLACCEELSEAGESLPIILDDPLMAADDTRFITGFKYIVQSLARKHQVIIFSCHKSRHKQERVLDVKSHR